MIADEGDGEELLMRRLRDELAAGEAQLLDTTAAMNEARANQATLEDQVLTLSSALGTAQADAETQAAARSLLEIKLRDMISVTEAEIRKISDHTERLQGLRFVDHEAGALRAQLQAAAASLAETEAALAQEHARSQQHAEELRAAHAHAALLDEKLQGVLAIMASEAERMTAYSAERAAPAAPVVVEVPHVVETPSIGAIQIQHGNVVRELEAQRDEAIHRERDANDRHAAALSAIYASTSWKIGKPVRLLGRLLIRFKVKQ
ncbi:hypothetical protein DDF62_11285 [Caulobacter radicis]|nr:hypothetical protein DDF62_11285 [Caulobacter radicis]